MSRRRLVPMMLVPNADDDPLVWARSSLMTGLVASFRFENAADIGHDDFNYIRLGVVGSVTQATGFSGQAAVSAGSGNSLYYDHASPGDGQLGTDPSAGLTIAGWFKFGTSTGAGAGRTAWFIDKASAGSSTIKPRLDFSSTGGTHLPILSFTNSGSTYKTITHSAIADPGTWRFHCVRIKSGAQRYRINTTELTLSETLTSEYHKQYTVGLASDSITADSLLVYNRFLTDDEVDALYRGGLGRDFAFGWEPPLSRVTSSADSSSAVTSATLTRVTAVADSTTVVTPAFLSRVTSSADSTTGVSGAFLARLTASADSTAVVAGAFVSRVTASADSTDGVTPAFLARLTAEADSTTVYSVEVANLLRVTASADSSDGVASAMLFRVTSSADSESGVTPALFERITSAADSVNMLIGDPAFLERVTAVADSTRTARYAPGTPRPDPDFLFVFPTEVRSQFGTSREFLEETHARITATLRDDNGDDLSLTDFDLVLLTIHSKRPFAFLRKTTNAAGLIDLVDGEFSWLLQPRDTDLVDGSKVGATEGHVATFEFAHASDRVDDLVDPFSVTSGSSVVTVTHPGHGLEVGEHVSFDATDEVGGLSLSGLFLVTEVVDADTFRTAAHQNATATAADAGGAVVAYLRPYSNKWVLDHSVKQADLM